MKIQTPLTSHLSSIDFESVYEPAEDSFLVLDTLEIELEKIKKNKSRPLINLEIGSGSGVLSAALSSALNTSTCFTFATDINPSACKASSKTFERNGITRIEAINTDILFGLENRLSQIKVDILICNPPYVATSDNEAKEDVKNDLLIASWAGGEFGRLVTDPVLKLCPTLLNPDIGVGYIVLEQCNQTDKVLEFARQECGLYAEIINSRKAGREYLSILKVTLNKDNL